MKTTTKTRPFQILSLLILVTALLSGQRSYSRFHYTSRDGLPQNSVRSLVFDHFGFLWMTTEAGIVRFDGNDFHTYTSQGYPHFSTDRFSQAIKINDTLLVFSDPYFGLYRLDNNTFHILRNSMREHIASAAIRGGLPDTSVFSGPLSLANLQKRPWQWSNVHIYVFPIDADRYFIIKNDHTIEYYQKGRAVEYISCPELHPKEFFMIGDHLLAFDRDNKLYRLDLATRRFSRCNLRDATDGRWKKEPLKSFIFCSYPFNNAFLAQGRNLYRIDPLPGSGQYAISLILQELPDHCIVKQIVFRPEDHLLAVGTDTKGLFLYRRHFLTSLLLDTLKAGTNEAYYAQAVLESNSILTNYGRIFDMRGVKKSAAPRFPYTFSMEALYLDSTGILWYSNEKNLYACDTRKGLANRVRIYSNRNVTCFLQGADRLWVGTQTGIGYVKGDSVIYVDHTVSHYKNNPPQDMCFDDSGRIWYGITGNVYRLDTKSGTVDSFALFKKMTCRAVRAIGGKIFIGTYGHGYFIFHEGRFYRMPMDRNRDMAYIHTFISDKNGFLWMPTNRGLFKTSLASIEAYLQDTSGNPPYYFVYREEDGIRNSEFNGGCSPAFVELPDGSISLPSMEGLVLFQPDNIPEALPRDTILIGQFLVDGKVLDNRSGSVIPAEHQIVEVLFSTAWWQQPDNLLLEYKLEGVYADWRPIAGNQRRLIFGQLNPGDYTLLLRKRCGFGPTDFVTTRIAFSVDTPWYSRWWSVLLFLFGLAGLALLAARFYVQAIRRRNVALQRKVDSQTHALKNINKNLQLNLQDLERSENELRQSLSMKDRLISILSHDISTPLRFISMIARFAMQKNESRVENMSAALGDIRNASDKLFGHAQNMINWIKYQDKRIQPVIANCHPFAIAKQLIEDFKELAQFKGNRIINQIPEADVIRTDPNILSILLHNLLSNAVKFTDNGLITISAHATDTAYEIKVTDTGRGMTAAQLEQVSKEEFVQKQADMFNSPAGNSLGLVLVRDLTKMLKGAWEIKNVEGKGVCVSIKLPAGV